MNGNLEPDERVLDDSVRYPGGMLGQLKLSWRNWGGSMVMRLMWRSEVLRSLVLMWVKCTIRSNLRLVLVSTTKMPSSSLRINLVEI